jgi:hypothetical protein
VGAFDTARGGGRVSILDAARSVERHALIEARGYEFAQQYHMGSEKHRLTVLAWLLEARMLRSES